MPIGRCGYFTKKILDRFLEDLINVLPDGCFCPPSQATINNLSLALLPLSAWATFAPIPAALKLKLKAAIMKVLDEIHASPFSCCESMQALEDLYIVLVEVVRALNLGIPQRLELMSLLQQLQGIISRYIACLACEPGPTGATGPTGPTGKFAYVTNHGNDTGSIVDLTTNTIIPPTITGFSQPFDIAIK